MSESLFYNVNAIRTREANAVRCNCGQRFAGTNAHLQVINVEKEIWTNISCPNCERKKNHG